MIEKKTETEPATIDIQEDGSVILREKVTILEDGAELTHSYVQRTIKPGDDLSGETERVARLAEAARI